MAAARPAQLTQRDRGRGGPCPGLNHRRSVGIGCSGARLVTRCDCLVLATGTSTPAVDSHAEAPGHGSPEGCGINPWCFTSAPGHNRHPVGTGDGARHRRVVVPGGPWHGLLTTPVLGVSSTSAIASLTRPSRSVDCGARIRACSRSCPRCGLPIRNMAAMREGDGLGVRGAAERGSVG
jgi:hypothetical protein